MYNQGGPSESEVGARKSFFLFTESTLVVKMKKTREAGCMVCGLELLL